MSTTSREVPQLGAAGRAVRRLVPLVAGASLLLGAASVPSVTTTAVGAVPTGQPATAGVTAQASAATQQVAVNPLAGRPWGVYKGLADASWAPYANATGVNKALLAKIALRPKATWFGAWISNADIATRVRQYISVSQAGNPNALVQMTVFRMVPWEHAACRRLPTAAEQASYKQWTDRFASAVGTAHLAIILQPDGPFALCAPGKSLIPSQLIAYSARVFSALPNTSVYIDAGAWDWPRAPGQGGVPAAVQILLPAGIQHARGIALNSTHYSPVTLEVERGAAIVRALAARGIPGKKVVISTSSNGNPFEFGKYTGPDPDNAWVCASATDKRTCVKLGIPPTTDVANPRWGLSAATNQLARAHVDGYMWFGRPWLHRQNSPFDMARALQLGRTSLF
jgi:endoglucanase